MNSADVIVPIVMGLLLGCCWRCGCGAEAESVPPQGGGIAVRVSFASLQYGTRI
jgi:hypothetical protein